MEWEGSGEGLKRVCEGGKIGSQVGSTEDWEGV